ncbi:MAG: Type 1 glutamine amidotransferase-like domain-containing protein [Candidatus Limnocylindrales bacterium]|jgi:peptidase E
MTLVQGDVRRIVAMGGGTHGEGDLGSTMHDFLLGLVDRPRPRICLVPTASADDRFTVAGFFDAFATRAEASWLPLFGRRDADLRARVLDQDIVLVWGGNTANMLAIWRAHGFDTVLREAWHAGVVLAGMSAGAICWFEASTTDSFGPELAPLHDGLGLLSGSCCPHYDAEPLRRPLYRGLVEHGFPAGYAIDDAAAIVFRGTELAEVVASTATAQAWRVALGANGVEETPLPARFLGQPGG